MFSDEEIAESASSFDDSASSLESSVKDTEVSSDDMTTINAETHLMFAL
jgi:hypothetical protein